MKSPGPKVETADPEEEDRAKWCLAQDIAYKLGYLDGNKIAKMESIPGWKWGLYLKEHVFSECRDKAELAFVVEQAINDEDFPDPILKQHLIDMKTEAQV